MLNNHPQVTPKDQVDDVVHYLRYAARFAPPGEDAPHESTPRWYWRVVILLSLTATLAGSVLATWVSLRIAFKMLGW